MSGADWSDCQESDADIVSIDEASGEFSIDDLGEQRAHGWGIVECGGWACLMSQVSKTESSPFPM